MNAGKTVRLIRGPGGTVRRAEPQDGHHQSASAAGARATADASDSDDEQGGMLLGPSRPYPGWYL